MLASPTEATRNALKKGKIVLFTAPYDQGDILADFLDWHLDLGIDLILALDHGSTDGSRETLADYARNRPVVWFPTPERDISKYSPADMLASMARDQYHADWVIHCDVDEFLCSGGDDLRTVLAKAERDGVTQVIIDRHNMTALMPDTGQRAMQSHILRVEKPIELNYDDRVSGDLPVPWLFSKDAPHLAVRTSALVEYGNGAHSATLSWGKAELSDQLFIQHYPIRGYDEFEQKVRNTEDWLASNKHLEQDPLWAWHWRRWIRLRAEGRLREDYEAQFIPPTRAQELVREGTCVFDDTVSRWSKRRENSANAGRLSKLLQRVATGGRALARR
jgi:hypothetical protein